MRLSFADGFAYAPPFGLLEGLGLVPCSAFVYVGFIVGVVAVFFNVFGGYGVDFGLWDEYGADVVVVNVEG